jgi:hypothetical protein
MPRRICAFYAHVDKPGSKDATGAFVPQALRFAKRRRQAGDLVALFPFENADPSMARRRQSITDGIRNAAQKDGPFDAFVYFGHGLRRSLPSGGFDLITLPDLAKAMIASASSAKNLVITLFACSTGEAPGKGLDGDGGLADILRDMLSERGYTGWVDAHTNAAHTTENPYARRFVMDGKGAAVGGQWIVEPRTELWPEWRRRLDDDEVFRFAFPYMSVDEIRRALAKKG